MKICSKCKINKELNENNFRVCKYSNGSEYFKTTCRECECHNSNKYNANHREERKEYTKVFTINNPNYKKQWKIDNKDKINKQYSERLQNDIGFRLRKNCSRAINRMLKINNSSKFPHSILDFLPYTVEELKYNLESKFESWMNWDNYGQYSKQAWDEEDQSTWKWNIDHIIPQSDLPYTSMEDDNFNKCWSLANIRPYQADKNSLDGSTRIRHK